MERCSAITLARAMLGTHSIRPSSGEVASTLRAQMPMRSPSSQHVLRGHTSGTLAAWVCARPLLELADAPAALLAAAGSGSVFGPTRDLDDGDAISHATYLKCQVSRAAPGCRDAPKVAPIS